MSRRWWLRATSPSLVHLRLRQSRPLRPSAAWFSLRHPVFHVAALAAALRRCASIYLVFLVAALLCTRHPFVLTWFRPVDVFMPSWPPLALYTSCFDSKVFLLSSILSPSPFFVPPPSIVFHSHDPTSHKTPPPLPLFPHSAPIPLTLIPLLPPFVYILFLLCLLPPLTNSADSGRSFFDHPHQAPLPPTLASRSARSTPEGFVLPVVPPANDPLVVTRDAHGHRRLPHVSDSLLSVDDGRVLKLVQHHPMVVPKCANCAEMVVECNFTEAGIPCPPCSVLGIPDCDWADPYWFMENLQRCRDLYLLDERHELVKSVKDNRLAPSLFEHEFERVQSWFYSGAQGAMSRFLINSHATRNIAVRGYQSLAAASTDPTLLLCFFSLGAETQVHPLILQVVKERVQSLFLSISFRGGWGPVSTVFKSCFNTFRFNAFFDLISLKRHVVKHEIPHCGYVSLHPTVPVSSAIKGSVADLSIMVFPIPGSLSKANEEIVRKVFKTIRATKYEDPVDQAAFLVDSANTVLEFRPQVASFALVPELGECVFTIRSMMHTNNTHLGTPFSDAFISIQDFAGEIIRKRQLFRERRRANADRVRAAEGAAARIERNTALEHAANTDKAPPSPNEDAVSIPSGSDGSGTDEPPPASMPYQR
ncbi:hypothetical protein B0H14DRAFT_2583269 [Mycena olivaceomarginata]|nr:hypothetical protein B0H14DRAFT_2583269 [Mycena olivaceomarginata]